MNINSANISEDNIEQYIEERLDKDFIKIFKELKEDVKINVQDYKYNSLSTNYIPIFLYHVMNRGIDTNRLSIILKLSDNYEGELYRFFHPNPADVSFDEQNSLWDNINHYFYKEENNKIIIDSSKMNYVEEICLNVRRKNLLEFHSSKIDLFFTKYIYENENYTDRFANIIKENPLLDESNILQYVGLSKNILRNLADFSFDTNIETVYNKLKCNELLYLKIKEELISFNQNNKYRNNLSFIEMVSKNDSDFFQIYHERILDLKKDLDTNILSENDYIEIIKDCKYSMISMLKEKNTILDINTINLEEPIITNIPYLYFIEGLIENNQLERVKNLNLYFIDYLKENKKELLVDELYGLSFFTEKKIDKIFSFLDYYELNMNLENKTTKEKKIKI